MLNYLKEDLAFLNACTERPVSPRTHVLWHYLLYFNNLAAVKDAAGDYYWPVWFSVDNRVLVKALGLKNSNQLYHYRRTLVDRGWVRHRVSQVCDTHREGSPRVSTPKPEYALTPFTPGFEEGRLGLGEGLGEIAVWVFRAASAETAGETLPQQPSYLNKSINIINKALYDHTPPDLPSSFTDTEQEAFAKMEREQWGSNAWKQAFRTYVGMDLRKEHT